MAIELNRYVVGDMSLADLEAAIYHLSKMAEIEYKRDKDKCEILMDHAILLKVACEKRINMLFASPLFLHP